MLEKCCYYKSCANVLQGLSLNGRKYNLLVSWTQTMSLSQIVYMYLTIELIDTLLNGQLTIIGWGVIISRNQARGSCNHKPNPTTKGKNTYEIKWYLIVV